MDVGACADPSRPFSAGSTPRHLRCRCNFHDKSSIFLLIRRLTAGSALCGICGFVAVCFKSAVVLKISNTMSRSALNMPAKEGRADGAIPEAN